MANLLNREALLAAAARPLPKERLSLPELGGDVWVRAMSGKERDEWEKSLIVGRGKRRTVNTDNVRAKLAVQCLCDESGARLLQDGDESVLGGLRVDTLNKMFESAQRLSGVSDEDIDELGKPSEPAAGSGSPTN